MAQSRSQHPSVFVACPYKPKQRFEAFRAALKRVPLEFHFAMDSAGPGKILEDVSRHIKRSDYGLYDFTSWNANVMLELGFARGLARRGYILFRPGRGIKARLPTNVEGDKFIGYRKLDGFSDDCLTYQLNHKLVKPLPHVSRLYPHLRRTKREKRFAVAMRILAHFRDNHLLQWADLDDLRKGSRLSDADLKELLSLLRRRELIIGQRKKGWRADRPFYKKLQF